jgi:hypothetical protein
MNEREPLIQGAMYRVVVKIPGVFTTPRESVMKLIDVREDTYQGQMLVFSARPKLGTQEIEMKYVTELEIQPADALVYVSWKVTSKKPPEKWKYER